MVKGRKKVVVDSVKQKLNGAGGGRWQGEIWSDHTKVGKGPQRQLAWTVRAGTKTKRTCMYVPLYSLLFAQRSLVLQQLMRKSNAFAHLVVTIIQSKTSFS